MSSSGTSMQSHAFDRRWRRLRCCFARMLLLTQVSPMHSTSIPQPPTRSLPRGPGFIHPRESQTHRSLVQDLTTDGTSACRAS